MEYWIDWLLATLALPKIGLPALFIVGFISATLLPLGSEPAVFGYIKLNPDMFWPAILVATLGNVLGGAADWWMGYAAKLGLVRLRLARRVRQSDARRSRPPRLDRKYFRWMRRLGPVSLLASWLPGIGDPLCALAGWLRLPFWPSLLYMAIGKFLRYLVMTMALLTLPDDFWRGVLRGIQHLVT